MHKTQSQQRHMVDHNELRVNQLMAMFLLVVAFIFDNKYLVVMQSVIFLLTVLSPWLGVYVLFYRLILKPLKIIQADNRVDVPEAHRFAMSIGFIVSAIASYLLFSQASIIGWSLVWLIIGLGVLAFLGWCAGCFTYSMLQKLGLKGFFRPPVINGVLPGTRPPREDMNQEKQ